MSEMNFIVCHKGNWRHIWLSDPKRDWAYLNLTKEDKKEIESLKAGQFHNFGDDSIIIGID